jgi:hypothetical protein
VACELKRIATKSHQGNNMPVHKATGPRGGKGWQYGTSGKVYPTRAAAVRQAQAIKASQTTAKKEKK